jgi:nitrite reductase/ring-hydroxylating ferredoxin subunit/uncharacterized membrane protein
VWWSTLTGKVEQAKVLDPVADGLEKVVTTVLPKGPVKDVLHGTWLGHSVHPLLVALPIGMWSGASLLDFSPHLGARRASRTLIGAGLLAAVPTVATGLADWSEVGAFRRPKRVGVVHAGANTVTLLLYLSSWRARRRGEQVRGITLALAGAASMSVGGYLGGHLAYAQGVGVNRNADEQKKPRDWTDVDLDPATLPLGEVRRVEVKGQQVLVARTSSGLQAIGNTCSHYAAPLDEGELRDGDDPCVVCPWHGSEFRLSDGAVVHGPATAPQLSYEVRTPSGGGMQIRVRA